MRAAAWSLLAAASVACSSQSVPVSTEQGATPRYDGGGANDASSVSDAGSESDAPTTSDDGGSDAKPDALEQEDDDPPALCAALVIGAGQVLPFSTAEDDHGLTVTPNGLSAAWVTKSGPNPTIHYVDRADASSDFGAERTTTGAFADDRVALTPDGLGLAVVNADRLGFSLLSRASTADAFGPAEVGPFANLNEQGASSYAAAGLTYADPVFARNGAYLLFSRVGGAATEPTVLVATHFLPTDPLSFGSPFAESALLPVGGQRKIVTSVSSDLRTLFVWDEAAQKARVVTLAPSFEPTGTADVGTMKDLQASTDCRTVHFTRNGDLYRFQAP